MADKPTKVHSVERSFAVAVTTVNRASTLLSDRGNGLRRLLIRSTTSNYLALHVFQYCVPDPVSLFRPFVITSYHLARPDRSTSAAVLVPSRPTARTHTGGSKQTRRG